MAGMTETEKFEQIKSFAEVMLPFVDIDWDMLTPLTVWHERIRGAIRYCRIMERVEE